MRVFIGASSIIKPCPRSAQFFLIQEKIAAQRKITAQRHGALLYYQKSFAMSSHFKTNFFEIFANGILLCSVCYLRGRETEIAAVYRVRLRIARSVKDLNVGRPHAKRRYAYACLTRFGRTQIRQKTKRTEDQTS
jgi:hypothetical protein